jgi:hypothetical protein
VGDRHQQMSHADLVKLTFEAFEAWSADRGRPRRLDQTPWEFVEAATSRTEAIGPSARELCRLYGRVAYGGAGLLPADMHRLRELWQAMCSVSPPPVVAAS